MAGCTILDIEHKQAHDAILLDEKEIEQMLDDTRVFDAYLSEDSTFVLTVPALERLFGGLDFNRQTQQGNSPNLASYDLHTHHPPCIPFTLAQWPRVTTLVARSHYSPDPQNPDVTHDLSALQADWRHAERGLVALLAFASSLIFQEDDLRQLVAYSTFDAGDRATLHSVCSHRLDPTHPIVPGNLAKLKEKIEKTAPRKSTQFPTDLLNHLGDILGEYSPCDRETLAHANMSFVIARNPNMHHAHLRKSDLLLLAQHGLIIEHCLTDAYHDFLCLIPEAARELQHAARAIWTCQWDDTAWKRLLGIRAPCQDPFFALLDPSHIDESRHPLTLVYLLARFHAHHTGQHPVELLYVDADWLHHCFNHRYTQNELQLLVHAANHCTQGTLIVPGRVLRRLSPVSYWVQVYFPDAIQGLCGLLWLGVLMLSMWLASVPAMTFLISVQPVSQLSTSAACIFWTSRFMFSPASRRQWSWLLWLHGAIHCICAIALVSTHQPWIVTIVHQLFMAGGALSMRLSQTNNRERLYQLADGTDARPFALSFTSLRDVWHYRFASLYQADERINIL